MKSLLFACPGIPLSTSPRDTLNGVKRVKELGLDAMELEFVHNVNVNEKLAPELKSVSNKLCVVLTCHGQYYVNLASTEIAKQKASVNRIVSAATRAFECGAYSVVWHFGFYLNRNKFVVYDLIKKNIKVVLDKLKEEDINIWIRPETTGKFSQWGDLDEVIDLSNEFEQVLPCIDFSHLHARDGLHNTFDEFKQILSKVESKLGRNALNNMHMHCAGINYGPKGELNHLNLNDSDMNYSDLLKALKEFKVKGVLTCESPNVESDALLLKKTYFKL